MNYDILKFLFEYLPNHRLDIIIYLIDNPAMIDMAIITFFILLITILFLLKILFSIKNSSQTENTKHIFKYSVNWNKSAIPHCIVCDKILLYQKSSKLKLDIHHFYCMQCKRYISAIEGAHQYDALEAIEEMKKLLKISSSKATYPTIRVPD